MLIDSGSAWELNVDVRGLTRRVDPTAIEAWRQARDAAHAANQNKASLLLTDAWKSVYGMHPDPDAGYAAAVHAVEAAAVPVLRPGTGSTIHAAVRTFSNQQSLWRFALLENLRAVSAGDGSVDVVANMLNRLLTGQTHRHTSDPANRANTSGEAGAAVHLAVVLVQWFTSGAIQPQT